MDPDQTDAESQVKHVGSQPSTVRPQPPSSSSPTHKRAAIVVALVVLAVTLATGLAVALGRRQDPPISNAATARDRDRDPDPAGGTNNTNGGGTNITNGGGTNITNGGLDIPRLQAVTQFLSQDTTEAETFNDVTSPQFKASRWIADEDDLNVDIPRDPDSEGEYYFIQRYVMAVFYFALDGPNWVDDLGFLSGDDICGWNMALDPNTVPDEIDPATWFLGVWCDDEDEVRRIFFPNNGLSGALPSELGKLITLDHLSLYRNNIQGSISDTMQNLVNLTFVNLENNALTGTLPAWLNKWANLEVLGLGNNEFSGQLPMFTGMESLTQLALDNNELSGTVDNLAAATALQVLFLENNTFTGVIDDDFVLITLENLRFLNLGGNQFVGSFPAYLYSLDVVDLSNNNLTGSMAPVPDDGSIELNLWYLSVYSNEMTGGLPTGLSSLELEHLDVAKNQMTGSLEGLDGSTEFRQLYLSQNDFTEGPIPNLNGCTELEVLSMSQTNRIGTIDVWVGDLSELLVLDLHDNALTGPIPSELGQLENLEVLMLQRNNLIDGIPLELANLENIVKVFLENNALTATVDEMVNFCDNIEDAFDVFVVDDVIEGCECCTVFCPASDVDCNAQTELEKRDYDIKDGSEEAIVSENLNIYLDED